MVIVAYFFPNELEYKAHFQTICEMKSNLNCLFHPLETIIPINQLKNLGIDAVTTTHFLFAECNLVPTSILFLHLFTFSEFV